MNVTYLCPNCERTVRVEIAATSEAMVCPACDDRLPIAPDALADGRLTRCLACPSTELFIRKDFPQRLGVGVVVAGIVGSSIAWGFHEMYWAFAILFATALVDVALYLVVGDALMCYRCQAQYRGFQNDAGHSPFNLETHEKHRQVAARAAESRR
jgi:DNA-directed RNA polymerase subunit RPC12/RpoP